MKIRGKDYDKDFCEKLKELFLETGSCVKVLQSLEKKVPAYVVYEILKFYNIEYNQQKKREEKRHKTCAYCGIEYFDETKRIVGKTCSKNCASKMMTETRHASGSYQMKEQQKEKISIKLKHLYETGQKERYTENGMLGTARFKEKYANDEKFREDIKKKKEVSYIKKYGTSHSSKNEEVKQKIKKTNLEKYGTEHPTKNKDVKNKTQNTRLERGLNKVFEGKTYHEWAKDVGVSYSYFKQVVNERGFDEAKKLSSSQSDIEALISSYFQENKIEITYNKFLEEDTENKYRPDFLAKERRLIVECDGLFWHSDKMKDNDLYHNQKRNFYKSLGYDVCFFRSDEILNKFSIVCSIINNKLKINKNKIFARKCKTGSCNSHFFEENHLMGKGSGRIYSLIFDENVVAAIQVKWKNKQQKILEVSRFCTKNNTSVIGGFSKLIKHAIETEKPKKITTFIDQRYGDGEYLKSLGFYKTSDHLSFMWTDGEKTWHRLRYPGNTGYDVGLAKIWDCGQSKWDLDVL